MDDRTHRSLLTASAVGSAVFIGIFGWLWISGFIPLALFLIFLIGNVVFGAYALRLRSRYSADGEPLFEE